MIHLLLSEIQIQFNPVSFDSYDAPKAKLHLSVSVHPCPCIPVRQWKETIALHRVSYTSPCPYFCVCQPVSVHGWEGIGPF